MTTIKQKLTSARDCSVYGLGAVAANLAWLAFGFLVYTLRRVILRRDRP